MKCYNSFNYSFNLSPCRRHDGLTRSDISQVSQGDATEKLAHQVPTKTAAAHRRLEEASGHPHAEEKDETHESSKGHVSGKYGYCCMSE